MQLIWIIGLPFLAFATWQDYKERKYDDNLAKGLAAFGMLALALFNPLPYDFAMSAIVKLTFIAVTLMLGWFFQGTGAWKEGDTWMLAAVGFASLPMDIYLFMAIALATLVCYTAPMKLKRIKESHGILAIMIIYVLYNMIAGL